MPTTDDLLLEQETSIRKNSSRAFVEQTAFARAPQKATPSEGIRGISVDSIKKVRELLN
jgi:hypothetical protein